MKKMMEDLTCMDFGNALTELKKGSKVTRLNWNGKGMWISLTPEIVTSEEKTEGAVKYLLDAGRETITINSHIDMRTVDGTVQYGWTPSQADIMSEDWVIIEKETIVNR